ncbi:MAG: ribonuclease [Candidatus Doudnabacteria bacterium]|nr:ribonuclease [Candidatus Doudnabacteria bacterium]
MENFEPERLVIFTDGGARGNPGAAGIGVVLYLEDEQGNRKHLQNLKEYIGEHTNNFAEYTALIRGLERCSEIGHKNIQCYLDSELVVKQLNGLYKIREESLKPLAAKVLLLKKNFNSCNFTHIHREKNAAADKLVNEAIDAARKTN